MMLVMVMLVLVLVLVLVLLWSVESFLQKINKSSFEADFELGRVLFPHQGKKFGRMPKAAKLTTMDGRQRISSTPRLSQAKQTGISSADLNRAKLELRA